MRNDRFTLLIAVVVAFAAMGTFGYLMFRPGGDGLVRVAASDVAGRPAGTLPLAAAGDKDQEQIANGAGRVSGVAGTIPPTAVAARAADLAAPADRTRVAARSVGAADAAALSFTESAPRVPGEALSAIAAVQGRPPDLAEIAMAIPAAGVDPINTAATEPAAPVFDIVRVERTGETVLAGTAHPASLVELVDGDRTLARAEANERGEFVLVLDRPLSPGSHDLALRTISADRRFEMISTQRVAVLVPERQAEDALVLLNEPGVATRVLQRPDGAAPTVATRSRAFDAAAAAAGLPVEPAPGDLPLLTLEATEVEGATLFVAGAATGANPVRVYVDGAFVGEVLPASGRWLLQADHALAPGDHTVRADQVGAGDGAVVARAEVPFNRPDELAPGGAADAGAPRTVVIRRGDNLWQLSQRLLGDGNRYTTLYEANRGQIRNPGMIFPGQIFVLPPEAAPPAN